MKISTESWHYRLFTEYAGKFTHQNLTICEYVRGVMFGMFIVAGIIVAMLFVGIFLLEPLLVIGGWGFTGQFVPFLTSTLFTFVVGCLVYGIIIGSLLYAYIEQLREKRRQRLEKENMINLADPVIRSPSPFASLVGGYYRSLKEKTCFKVEVIDPSSNK